MKNIFLFLTIWPFVEITFTSPCTAQNSPPSQISYRILNTNAVALPLNRLVITSPFGWRYHPILKKNQFHNGVDLQAYSDTVHAIFLGKIAKIGTDNLLGKHIIIEHSGFRSIYGHLSSFLIDRCKDIEPGAPIGITGNTGRSTGEHLHFSIQHQRKYIHPLKFLRALLTGQ